MVDGLNNVDGNRQRGRIVQWIDHRLPIFTFVNHELKEYSTPRNLNYWWNFGSLAGVILIVMILSGVTLAMHYTPDFKPRL